VLRWPDVDQPEEFCERKSAVKEKVMVEKTSRITLDNLKKGKGREGLALQKKSGIVKRGSTKDAMSG